MTKLEIGRLLFAAYAITHGCQLLLFITNSNGNIKKKRIAMLNI